MLMSIVIPKNVWNIILEKIEPDDFIMPKYIVISNNTIIKFSQI